MNGNCQGYAKGRQIAINPVAQMPAKTTFHELAHIELGHTTEAIHDSYIGCFGQARLGVRSTLAGRSVSVVTSAF